MVLLALLSGLINLSSQVVYQKVVSMVAGDLYTTFMAVTLTFIFGSAIGSYFGNRVRPYLTFIELGSGLFSLLIYFLLQGPFYEQKIPTALVVAGLFLPALALGTHIPLYSYYLRRLRFGFVYCLYHFGAIFGLLGFEWYFVHAGSVKASMLFVGITQIVLGVLIGILYKMNHFTIENKKTKVISFLEFLKRNGTAIACVVLASTMSFYIVLWALKTQTMLTETYRLHATSVSAAVFVWMALAGVLNKITKYFSTASLFLGMAISFVFIQATFPSFGPGITYIYDGTMPNYFLISLLLSVYLSIPVFFSSLIFVKQTQELQTRYDVDVASGILNLYSSFGNISGFILAGVMASFFWTKEYFIFIAVLALLVSLALSFANKTFKKIVPMVIVVLISTLWFGQKEHKNYLFVNRIGQYDRECQEVGAVEVYSHPFTTMALYETRKRSDSPSNCYPIMPSRRYVIDGHISHNVWSGMEFISGLSSAQYFDRPLKNSVVIGIGSGQAAWAVAAISENTQLVEISPVVIDNLDHIKELNGDLKNRSGIEFILDDGFSFIRECKAGSLDLIFNTSTYPSSFNASKLYSDEFVRMAKRCLGKDGVYQTYFDESSVRDMRTLYEFLAPIQKHFKYVDIQTHPYPQVFAYDIPKNIQKLSATDFLRPEDYKYFHDEHAQDFDLACRPKFRMVERPSYAPRMNSLDRAYLEENSILSAVDVAHSDSAVVYSFAELYEPIPGSKPMPTCE